MGQRDRLPETIITVHISSSNNLINYQTTIQSISLDAFDIKWLNVLRMGSSGKMRFARSWLSFKLRSCVDSHCGLSLVGVGGGVRLHFYVVE